METEGYRDLLETSDGQGVDLLDGGLEVGVEESWSTPYPLGFQVSLTTVLMLELVLGFSSNLTVLVLYCAQSNLVDSVSNLVTVNLHVLDILVCVLCLPLTVAVILLPASGSELNSLATLCCFHEACVTFTSVATAVNVLVISLDRYDISVRPASRLLTPRRAALLLAAVWVVSLAVFFLPFLEGDFFSRADDGDDEEAESHSREPELTTSLTPIFSSLSPSLLPSTPSSSPPHHLPPVWQNRTLLCVGGQGYYTGMAMYYHLLLQVPCFFIAVAVMLFTYSRILQALNIRIGSHMMRGARTKDSTCRIRCRRRKRKDLSLPTEIISSNQNQNLNHPPLIPSPTPTSPPQPSSVPQGMSDSGATITTVSTAATTPIATTPATPASPTHIPVPASTQTHATSPLPASSMGVQASVSAIIALRRAVRRHRDRRERQRRVLKMSLLIISTFLGCWAPLSAVNVLILCMGPSDGLVRLRLCFLAMAYGTTIFHPLLYAFTRQKLRRALKTRVKKRVVSLLQVDPAASAGTVIHNSWVEGGGQRKNRKTRVEASDGTDRCLTEAVRE